MTFLWTVLGLFSLAHGSPTLCFVCLCAWVATGEETGRRE